MTWLTLYAAIKFWLPIITALGLLVKGFRLASAKIALLANTLLDNHMKHIQDSAEKAASAVVELSSYQKDNIDLQKNLMGEFTIMSRNLSIFCKDMTGLQQQTLTGIEILKDRD